MGDSREVPGVWPLFLTSSGERIGVQRRGGGLRGRRKLRRISREQVVNAVFMASVRTDVSKKRITGMFEMGLLLR